MSLGKVIPLSLGFQGNKHSEGKEGRREGDCVWTTLKVKSRAISEVAEINTIWRGRLTSVCVALQLDLVGTEPKIKVNSVSLSHYKSRGLSLATDSKIWRPQELIRTSQMFDESVARALLI